MTPQKAAPWTGCIHFCNSYPIMSSMSFTSVSIFSVWCCSRYLSLLTKRPWQKSVILIKEPPQLYTEQSVESLYCVWGGGGGVGVGVGVGAGWGRGGGGVG
jgi:hypothetical protein